MFRIIAHRVLFIRTVQWDDLLAISDRSVAPVASRKSVVAKVRAIVSASLNVAQLLFILHKILQHIFKLNIDGIFETVE